MAFEYGDAGLQSHVNSTRELVFDVNVDASASTFTVCQDFAANGIVVIRHESDTATADALECPACWDVGWTTPVDATGIFGVFIDKSKLLSDNGHLVIDKVYLIESNAPTTGTLTVTRHGDNFTRYGVAEEDGITTAGNIAFSIDSNQNLASTDVRFRFKIVYKVRN